MSVDKLAVGMEELIRRAMGPFVRVEVRLGDGTWLVRRDAGQLENALLNLAINARDAMAKGGWLTVSTGEAHPSVVTWPARTGWRPSLPP